ncbi:MAG: MFS transporter [Candidatus Promineifilaceae bacterium]
MRQITQTKTPSLISPPTLSAAMYFSFFMALGAFMPFLNLYYERLGMTGIQIGTLSAVPILVASSTVLIWGSIADKKQWHRGILRISFLFGAVTILLLSTANTFQMLLVYVVVYAFFTSPTVPLLDSAALEAGETSGRTYGELRLWGSVGWSISAIFIGYVIQRLAIGWIFYCYIAIILLTLLLSFFQTKPIQTIQTSLRSGYKQLLYNRSFLLFLLSIFFASLTLNAANAFFSIYLDAIGTSEGWIGIGWAIASMSEIPVMLFSGKLINRIGASGLLIIAFTAFAIRLFIFSFTATPALALSLQLLSGLSFAFYLVGGVTYVKERTPEGLTTTGQSIYNLVGFGIGSIAGSLIGGYLYEVAGLNTLFRLLSVIALAALVAFLLSRPNRSPYTQATPPE